MENRPFSAFFLRVMLGLIFLMQGYGKVFTWGVPNVYKSVFASYEATVLPHWLLWATAYFTSYAEFFGGLLLILGLYRKQALYVLGAVLLIVSFGHGLKEPIWDLSHVFPRAFLLVTLLILPDTWDRWHLDRWWRGQY
ncbi:MAG: DoxX family membrane protein [Saprospiraceae bacterium]|nr:DoxX family membrane protein [Saprospiraceae bacterium]